MQAGSELLPHLNAAISAAFKAGEEILEVYSRPVEVTLKDDRSPLTEADLRAHAAIVKVLTETGYPVLSEEGRTLTVNERQKWDRYWLVDPLDGTKEFIKRNGEFTINIALMERDDQPAGPLGTSSPILGVLYVPVTDVLYFS
ncbi:MAG TPA: inositol monophosphatase family protein, partial [Flavobacteriales bacterium]|nr:inositol monophosphatase family protein [Flavobacteriales bacterium]